MDDNRVQVVRCKSNGSGDPTLPIKINPVTFAVLMEGADESVSATVGSAVKRDENRVPVGAGVSSVDGVTPVPFHATAGGKLLFDVA